MEGVRIRGRVLAGTLPAVKLVYANAGQAAGVDVYQHFAVADVVETFPLRNVIGIEKQPL